LCSCSAIAGPILDRVNACGSPTGRVADGRGIVSHPVVPRESGSVCFIEGIGRVGNIVRRLCLAGTAGNEILRISEQGTVYPAAPVAIPREPLDAAENPAFVTRGFYAWEDRGNDEFFFWMARNRMNFWTSAQKQIPLLRSWGCGWHRRSRRALEFPESRRTLSRGLRARERRPGQTDLLPGAPGMVWHEQRPADRRRRRLVA